MMKKNHTHAPKKNNPKPMDKTTQERIKADAEKKYPRATALAIANRNGYVAGATAERERAHKLVDALHGLLEWHNTALGYGLGRRIEAAQEALQQWKGEGKEVGDG